MYPTSPKPPKKTAVAIWCAACLIVLLMPLTACETVIEVDLPVQELMLTINSVATPDSAFAISVSSGVPITQVRSDHRFTTPAGTQVKITGPEGEFELTFTPTCAFGNCDTWPNDGRRGIFKTDAIRPRAGQTYSLEATAPRFQTATATITIPHTVPIDQVHIDTLGQGENFGRPFTTVEIQLSFTDPAQASNYYGIELYAETEEPRFFFNEVLNQWEESTGRSWQRAFLNTSDPVVFIGQSWILNPEGNMLLLRDNLFNGQTRSLRFIATLSGAKAIRPVLRNIDRSLWEYIRSTDEQLTFNDNPLAEPVPVFGNIENGFGIFSAFAFDYRTIEL